MKNFEPVTEEYFAGIRPTFLSSLSAKKDLNDEKDWLVQDGLIPLLWFFYKHPRPDGVTARLAIHQSLDFVVPREWRKKVRLYNVVSDRSWVKRRRKKLIVICAFSAELLELGLGRAEVENITRLLKRESQKHEEALLFFYKTKNLGGTSVGTRLSMEPLSAILDSIRSKIIRYVSFQDLLDVVYLDECSVVEVNCRLLVSDNHMVHALLSKGAVIADSRSRVKFDKPVDSFFRFSPFHGLLLDGASSAKGYFPRFSFEIDALSRLCEGVSGHSAEKDSSPWPTWFAGSVLNTLEKLGIDPYL